MTTTALTTVLWAAAQPAYRAILAHPFMLELCDGSLSLERFSFYLVQDFHFLQAAARAFATAAARAQHDEWILSFNRCSTEVLLLERSLHERFFAELGLNPSVIRSMPLAPTNEAYSSYLQVVATQEGFPEAFAALLPCFWLYRHLGQELLRHDRLAHGFHHWAAFYGGSDYDEMMEGVLELVDQVGGEVDDATRRRMLERFLHCCRYEWMFWEMSYRQEHWPEL